MDERSYEVRNGDGEVLRRSEDVSTLLDLVRAVREQQGGDVAVRHILVSQADTERIEDRQVAA